MRWLWDEAEWNWRDFFVVAVGRRRRKSWSSGWRAGDATDETRLVACDALESHELGGEVVAVDGFLGAGTDGAGQVAIAAAGIADRLRPDTLFPHINKQTQLKTNVNIESIVRGVYLVTAQDLPQVARLVQLFNRLGVLLIPTHTQKIWSVVPISATHAAAFMHWEFRPSRHKAMPIETLDLSRSLQSILYTFIESEREKESCFFL